MDKPDTQAIADKVAEAVGNLNSLLGQANRAGLKAEVTTIGVSSIGPPPMHIVNVKLFQPVTANAKE